MIEGRIDDTAPAGKPTPRSADDIPDGEAAVPRHLAVILDGNRRWARQHGLPPRVGHRAGGENVMRFLSWCVEVKVKRVSLWPLSTENLHRSPLELADLLGIITEIGQQIVSHGSWRVNLIGNLSLLPHRHVQQLREITAAQSRPTSSRDVNIAVAYGGRDELLRAFRQLVRHHRDAGTLNQLSEGIGPGELARHLDTAGQPDPDLIIRTAGEQRLSGFMPWQATYAELYFTPVPWPAFGREDLAKALAHYQNVRRNFGR